MASYNPFNQMNSPFLSSSVENKGLFSGILRSMSDFGMDYQKMVMKNQVGISINEDPFVQKDSSGYQYIAQRAVAAVLDKKSIPYLDRASGDKRRILREYSIKDEIRNYVTIIADEAIIYDKNMFCSPEPLSDSYSQDIKDKYLQYFHAIYNGHRFNDGIAAWNIMRDLLIDGYITLEVIWDDKKKNIIAFARLDSFTVVPAYEPTVGNLWIQYPENPQLRRVMLDSQIIHISYSTQNEISEASYVEGLIRPYNQVKLLEQTKIMFNVINAQLHMKYTIPVGDMPEKMTKETISQYIANYDEVIEWNDRDGVPYAQGGKHLQYQKAYWFTEGSVGAANVEILAPEGHNLNENDMLTWFMNVLKRSSKIPFQRFEKENGGGNIVTDASEVTRDEVMFNNFITRLHALFKEVIVKPLRMQLCVEFPELIQDQVFLNSVDIKFNSNQYFEVWKRLANYEKKVNIMQQMLAIQTPSQRPYFHIDFLVDELELLTPEKKEENKAHWIKEANENAIDGAGAEAGAGTGSEIPSAEPTTEIEPTPPEETTAETQTEAEPEAGNEEGFEF